MAYSSLTYNSKSEFDKLLPEWNNLEPFVKNTLRNKAVFQTAKKGKVIHSGESKCIGLILVHSGQLRTFVMSDEGKEATLYRLFRGDVCLFSASCSMQSIDFDLSIEAEKDTSYWSIPATVYKEALQHSLVLSNYANELMSARFSDVMWVIEQILFKSMDERLAHFLLNETVLEHSNTLKITHEQIAHHLGSAREVISRLLKYLRDEGAITVTRGGISIKNREILENKITN